jgi:small neutral amino acid transporter SnatA (MarC family)
MASVMLLGSQEPARMGDWSLALALAWGATAVILFSATYLYKALGQAFLVAIERLMGMLLVAISVQMLMDGVAAWLKASP